MRGGQLIEFHLIFSVDQNFLLNLVFDQNFFFFFCQLIKFHLIKSSNNGILAFKKFWSSAKICKLFFGSWSKAFKLIELVVLANFSPIS